MQRQIQNSGGFHFVSKVLGAIRFPIFIGAFLEKKCSQNREIHNHSGNLLLYTWQNWAVLQQDGKFLARRSMEGNAPQNTAAFQQHILYAENNKDIIHNRKSLPTT
jgi:hypothetical protein